MIFSAVFTSNTILRFKNLCVPFFLVHIVTFTGKNHNSVAAMSKKNSNEEHYGDKGDGTYGEINVSLS